MDNKKFFLAKSVFILLCVLGVSAAVSVSAGSAGIPLGKVISVISGKCRGGPEHSILFDIRMPRIVLGIIIGGGLSVSGLVFQGIFRNPLVEPYTLGVSGGAAIAVSMCIVSGLNVFLPVSGAAGAVCSILLVYALGVEGQRLLLTGVMVSFVCSGIVMLIMAVSRTQDLHEIIFWIMGSLSEPDTHIIKTVSFVVLCTVFMCFLYSRRLNVLALGDEDAVHLGVDAAKTKRILFVLASVCAGCSVSVSGVIGFVGLVVPHFMRILFGADHRILIPASFLGGGIFLLLCDTAARTIISPTELPVGVITGVAGGCVFVHFLCREKRYA